MTWGATNELGEGLQERLPDWTIECEVDKVGRAYMPDPRDDPPQEELVSVTIRTDFEPPYSVVSSAYNEKRKMGDVHDGDQAETLEDALDIAEQLAKEVLEFKE